MHNAAEYALFTLLQAVAKSPQDWLTRTARLLRFARGCGYINAPTTDAAIQELQRLTLLRTGTHT